METGVHVFAWIPTLAGGSSGFVDVTLHDNGTSLESPIQERPVPFLGFLSWVWLSFAGSSAKEQHVTGCFLSFFILWASLTISRESEGFGRSGRDGYVESFGFKDYLQDYGQALDDVIKGILPALPTTVYYGTLVLWV